MAINDPVLSIHHTSFKGPPAIITRWYVPSCSTCFCFMVSFFNSWCLCTSTKYDHHWKKQDFWVVSELYPHFCSLKHQYFCLLQQRKNWALNLSAKSHSGWWFQPLWKIWKSIGMIIPNIWKIKIMFQTTNQHFFLLESSQIMSNPEKRNMQLETPRWSVLGISWGAMVGAGRPVTKGHRRREVENNRHTSPPKRVVPPMWQRYGLPSGKLT